MYAIVDIETTGGSPERSRITEIAIVLHDGKKVVKSYSTLVNPQCTIPYNITRFTGISNEMVQDAPCFHEIARDIIEFTEGAVFVAHNVRFDYGFVKAAFKDLGYNYHRKTLCTVRLSRSAFPGMPSYSLGNLCESLNIEIRNRHRALGDAEATAVLFTRIFEQNNRQFVDDWTPPELKRIAVPPLLDEAVFEKIPEDICGVYYFYDQQGTVIYVGKSVDIRKRLLQHFSNQSTRKSLRMHHEIADVSFENTGSELIALLLESDEIKKLHPVYNTSQKRTKAIPYFGIYQRTDEQGFVNLYIDRLKEDDEPLTTSDNLYAAKNNLYKAIDDFQLCLAKCDLHKTGGACFNHQIHTCNGACVQRESPEIYNERAFAAVESLGFRRKSFFMIDEGRTSTEKSVVLIEHGQYKGFGYVDVGSGDPGLVELRDCIRKFPHNKDIQKIVLSFMKGDIKIIAFSEELIS